jgi:hypothetical protein
MENQIDDPFFKLIVLATLVCGILFVTNQPSPSSVGKDARQHRAQSSIGNTLAPTLKYHLKSAKQPL